MNNNDEKNDEYVLKKLLNLWDFWILLPSSQILVLYWQIHLIKWVAYLFHNLCVNLLFFFVSFASKGIRTHILSLEGWSFTFNIYLLNVPKPPFQKAGVDTTKGRCSPGLVSLLIHFFANCRFCRRHSC